MTAEERDVLLWESAVHIQRIFRAKQARRIVRGARKRERALRDAVDTARARLRRARARLRRALGDDAQLELDALLVEPAELCCPITLMLLAAPAILQLSRPLQRRHLQQPRLRKPLRSTR